MIKDFTLQQKTDILQKVVGKEFDWNFGYVYEHGKMLMTMVVNVEYDQDNHFIKMMHNVLFEDGTRHEYRTDGSWFFDHFQNDIERKLNVEVFWEVTKDGVSPVMLNYDDLKKSDSWMIGHEYNGMIVFENYSRAMLCWYEKLDNNFWGK